VDFLLTDDQITIQQSIRELCADFPLSYWAGLDRDGAFPTEFVGTLMRLGWLSTLIPTEYGGGGQGLVEASVILEEIHRSGGNANACHAQLYTMGTILKHGSPEQKQRYLPEIAAGRLRLQAFAITEPDTGSDTLRLRTRAVREGSGYRINGQKTYISRMADTDLMLLLARTTPVDEVAERTDGLSVFLVDLREAGDAVRFSRIPMTFNHHTYQVFLEDLRVPADNLIGAEGAGFRYILDGMNAERILISSEAVGDGHFFVNRAVEYASTREVFGRKIGMNQGVQFPIAEAYADVEAASLMRLKAAKMFDAGLPCGAEANMAKLLASRASWKAANAAVLTYGGNAFAAEYPIERKFREAKLLETAPVSNNLVLGYVGQRVLGMPRSY
jgi:acyl-CoA dehydrogenase